MIFIQIDNNTLYLKGSWVKENALTILDETLKINSNPANIYLDQVSTLDTIGAMLICKLQNKYKAEFIINSKKGWYPFLLEK